MMCKGLGWPMCINICQSFHVTLIRRLNNRTFLKSVHRVSTIQNKDGHTINIELFMFLLEELLQIHVKNKQNLISFVHLKMFVGYFTFNIIIYAFKNYKDTTILNLMWAVML